MHYAKAPLTEALIDIRVKLPGSIGLKDIEQAHKGEEKRYPTKAKQVSMTSHVEFSPDVGSSTHAKQTQTGLVYRSEDNRQVWQVRLDGFTLSRLAPYDRWESLRDEAERLWGLYQSAAHPEVITRVAVRYINRVDLPIVSGRVNTEEYFRTGPEVSPGLSQKLAGFFMQLQMPQEDLKAHLVLTEASVPSENPDTVSVLLDIDLFREAEVPQDDASLWATFDSFRTRKNEVFEASITDRLREMIRE